jgi:hypothetical protein
VSSFLEDFFIKEKCASQEEEKEFQTSCSPKKFGDKRIFVLNSLEQKNIKK